MKKLKYSRFVTEDEIEGILLQKYPNHLCPSCGKNGIYAACIETQYAEERDEEVVLSFDVFCKECGDSNGKWDNANRDYFLNKR